MPVIVDFENWTRETVVSTPEEVEEEGEEVGTGNTSLTTSQPKKRISPNKTWCFTYNNPNHKFMDFLMNHYRIVKYVFQLEKGNSGTEHFQGCVKFDTNVRPKNLFGPEWDAIHWEKCSNWEASVRYCQKKDGRVRGPWLKGEHKITELKILTYETLKPWQKEITEIVDKEPDDRKIFWYWENKGGVGKSAFTKFLIARYGAMLLTGKGTDMKYAIANSGSYPDIVVVDCPRSMQEYISYPGIEEIKNGCFFCGKYESKQIIGNPPHIIVFANFPPDESKLSSDRWEIKEII